MADADPRVDGPPISPDVARPKPAPAPAPAKAPVAAPTPHPSPPFTSCVFDSSEIAKLPRRASPDLSSPADRTLRQAAQRTASFFNGAPPPSTGNTAVAYVYGRCAFEDIADALSTAANAEHRIYIAGWWGEPWTQLHNPLNGPPPVNPLLQDYLRSTQAQVRALYWNSPIKGEPGDNKAIVEFINSLRNGAAIEDGKLPRPEPPKNGPAAHHQKLIVVKGSLGLVAFLGGMDLINDRVKTGGFGPLHDVHVRLTGPAAATCLSVFRNRWLDHPAAGRLDIIKFKLSRDDVERDFAEAMAERSGPLESVTVRDGHVRTTTKLLVSVGKTFAKLSKFDPTESYSFAREGEQSAWRLVNNGIANARRWIYLEDQYLVSRRAKAELLKKIKEPEFQFLLMLVGNAHHFDPKAEDSKVGNIGELPYLTAARNEFREELMAIDPTRKKWRMFNLVPTNDPNRRPWCGDYVHSKTWIFDDLFVVVGSANCNDRGYTYDSEIVAGIAEDTLSSSGQFARDLRIALWRKHLGVPHSQLESFSKGLKFWLTPPPTAMISDDSELQDDPLLGKERIRSDKNVDYRWTHMIDPDADLIGRPNNP